MYKNQEHQKMVEIATSEEARAVYERHMKERDSNALTDEGIIKSYEIDTESLYYNPMGGMEVTVYVNGSDDEDMTFQFGIIKDDYGKIQSNGYIVQGKLSQLLRKLQGE